ncbi:MAG TPA: glycosyltransferase family 2 protein, partial [Gemmatimonadaceae bacterium]
MRFGSATERDPAVLYICIPVFNEAPTVGLVLWKLRKALQDYSREYEVVIYDDGSTDGTREAVAPYASVLPLTVVGPSAREGYGRALEGLVRHVTTATRYPRRDAMIVMQGDLTDQPDILPEMAKRFEGGADVVVAERSMADAMPTPVRRLRKFAGWLAK